MVCYSLQKITNLIYTHILLPLIDSAGLRTLSPHTYPRSTLLPMAAIARNEWMIELVFFCRIAFIINPLWDSLWFWVSTAWPWEWPLFQGPSFHQGLLQQLMAPGCLPDAAAAADPHLHHHAPQGIPGRTAEPAGGGGHQAQGPAPVIPELAPVTHQPYTPLDHDTGHTVSTASYVKCMKAGAVAWKEVHNLYEAGPWIEPWTTTLAP